MSISLESGSCPNCGFENSIHINECHNCHRALPWAGSEATQILTTPVVQTEDKAAKKLALVLQIAGCLVFWSARFCG